MSTPTTSTGPTPPSGTSNPVPLRSWFKSIIDWIVGLSPAGATVYDTGWVDVTPATGYTAPATIQVRRTGPQVFVRGRVNRTAGPFPTGTQETVVAAGSIPPEFRPASFANTATTVSNGTDGIAYAEVSASGGIALRVPTSITGSHNGFYLKALSGYQVN